MSFDEIVAREFLKKQDRSNFDRVLEQRRLCGSVVAGIMYDGFMVTEKERKFVLECNRTIRPISEKDLEKLKGIE